MKRILTFLVFVMLGLPLAPVTSSSMLAQESPGTVGGSPANGRYDFEFEAKELITSEVTLFLPIVTKGYPAVTGTLDNGGVVSGPDGVKIGAVTNALDAPLPVTIVSLNPPVDPVPSPSIQLGNYYRISAQREVVQSLDKSFILALPVPQSADTTRLAMAVYASNARLLDAGDPSGHHWELVPGVYDAANKLLLAQFPYLSQVGETVTLVHHPDMVTLQKGAGSQSAHSNPEATGMFVAACHNLTCEQAIKSQVENELEINRIEFSAHFSYPFPRLQGTGSDMSVDPPQINQPSDYYYVFIYPSTELLCTDTAGAYNPAWGVLWLCRADGLGGLTDFEKKVLRHEYFHALEFAYDPVLKDWEAGEKEDWITEGMADAVINSDVDWHRSGTNNIRPIDMSLRDNADLLEYQAEDFWVYLGRNRLGGGVEKLKETLVLGADLDAVIGYFGLFGFQDAYWAWVRNQVFEKQDDMDGALDAPCELLEAAAPHLLKSDTSPINGSTPPLSRSRKVFGKQKAI